jgi:hypothetical protein
MRRLLTLLFALLIAIPLCAQTAGQDDAGSGPRTWTAYLFDGVIFSAQGNPPVAQKGPIAVFTPSGDIHVVRIEATTLQGPYLAEPFGTNQDSCPVRPQVLLTDGVVSKAVTLVQPQGPATSPSYTDSGPFSLDLPAGRRIYLVYVPGQPNNSNTAFCDVGGLNITVQYQTK